MTKEEKDVALKYLERAYVSTKPLEKIIDDFSKDIKKTRVDYDLVYGNLKEITELCDRMTSGNYMHHVGCIKQGIYDIIEMLTREQYLVSDKFKNDNSEFVEKFQIKSWKN